MGLTSWFTGRRRRDRRLARCMAIRAMANDGMARPDVDTLNQAIGDAWRMLIEVWRLAAEGDRDSAAIVLQLAHILIISQGAAGMSDGGDSGGNRTRCVAAGMAVSSVLPGLDLDTDATLRTVLAQQFRPYPTLTVYAAHRIGALSAVSVLAESLTSVEFGERMSRRWYGQLAEDGVPQAASTLRHLRDLIAGTTTEIPGSPSTLQDAEALLRADITTTVDRLQLDRPGAFGTVSPVTAAAAAATRTGRYLVYLTCGITGSAAILIGPDSGRTTESVDLPGLDLPVLRARLGGFRAATTEWREQRSDPHEFLSVVDETLEWVGDVVWTPILARWPGLDAEPFSVVPLGETALLPLFTALVGGEPVCARRDVTVAPSARSLLLASTRSRPGDGGRRPVVLADGDGDGRPLRGVAAEADAVAARHGITADILRHAPGTTSTPTADTRSPAEIVELIRSATTVHLACHGDLDTSDPLDSWLTLGGPVRMRALLEEDFRPGTVIVLSACDLGTIGSGLPDEQIGFPAALLASGARAVVAAHWPVPDGRTSLRLMGALHARLADDTAPQRALGAAIGAAQAAGVPAAAWAAFTCYGV